jgi:hypothetical protein
MYTSGFFRVKNFRDLWLSLFFLCCFLNTHAQLSQPNRFELEQKSSDRNYTLVSLGQEGLAMVRDNEKYEDGKKLWALTLLDTALQVRWEGNLALRPRLNLIGYEYIPKHFFLLFKEGEANATHLQLIDFSLPAQEYTLHEIKPQVDFRLTHFSVCEASVLLGGYVGREPMVLIYSLSEKQLKVVPGFLAKDIELLDLRVNNNGTFNVLLAEKKSIEEKKLIVRTFDQTGTMLLEDLIVIDRDKNILSGITSTLVHDEMIIVGTFGDPNTKQAKGFYSTVVDPFSNQPINYSELTQLEHFVDYLGKKRVSKVKQNAEQQRMRGRPSQFKSSVSLIRIHEAKKGFSLLAEVYDPSTTMNSSPQWNNQAYNYGYGSSYHPYLYYPYGGRYYNTPYSSSSSSSNSAVKMLQSVVILFNKDGKVDWDAGLKFSDLKFAGLEQSSDFVEHTNGFVMAYKKKSEILSMKAFLYEKESVLDTTKIKTLYEEDVIKSESEEDGGIRFWYNQFFYCWGYQTLRNHTKKEEDLSRHVFYINKIKTD